MKQLYLLFLFSFLPIIPINLSAQSINGVPLKDVDVEYMRIIERIYTSSVNRADLQPIIDFDLGTKYPRYSKQQGYFVKDSSGNDLALLTAMDALNFFTGHGFEFVQVYSVPAYNDHAINFYLLRKKKSRGQSF